jgi:hypothetical protein
VGQVLQEFLILGAAPFTVFAQGVGFYSRQDKIRAKKGQIGIARRETENRGSENPHS